MDSKLQFGGLSFVLFPQIAFPIQLIGAATAERYTRIECV